jgi:hypothetical protein
MWNPEDRLRRILATFVVCVPVMLFVLSMFGPFWSSLFTTAFKLMPSRVAGNWTEVWFGIGIFVVTQLLWLWRIGWAEMEKRWKEGVGIGILSVAIGWVALFGYSLYLETGKINREAQLTEPPPPAFLPPVPPSKADTTRKKVLPTKMYEDETFEVAVEFARISFGGKEIGTSLWIRYPSSDGSCGGLSPIQGMYFLRIKNNKNKPISVVGYGMDVSGTPLIRVRTRMGIIVGTPNVIDGHFLNSKVHLSDIKVGTVFDFGQGPGFSMVQVPLNQSDFFHGIVLKMDLIDDLLQKPLQPGATVRGWVFLQSPHDNAPTIAGAGHVTLETSDSKTFSYVFDLRNPHFKLDNMSRIITVESFADLSNCKR